LKKPFDVLIPNGDFPILNSFVIIFTIIGHYLVPCWKESPKNSQYWNYDSYYCPWSQPD
jgi:hypothetical protein